MAKIGVQWLEPERDYGKTTFVLKKDIVCDRSRDHAAGSEVKAKWRSSGRTYKVRLLSTLKAKYKKDNSKNNEDKDDGRINEPEQMDEDDIPLAVSAKTNEANQPDKQPPRTIEEAPEPIASVNIADQLEQFQEKVIAKMTEFQNEVVKSMDSIREEVKELKNKYETEIAGMRTVLDDFLKEMRPDTSQQIKTVLDAVNSNHETAKQTLSLMNERIDKRKNVRETQAQPNGSPRRCDDKRSQVAFGQLEGGNVVAYHEDRRLFTINKELYAKMFYSSKTPSSFLRKLLKEIFSEKELSESNFNGTQVTSVSGLVTKKCLNREIVMATMGQIELEFPGSTRGHEAFGKLQETVNEECRQAARRERENKRRN
ncbi:hypothetical protein HOLleu_43289 [Holothuria leucospilota]|uniref:BEN domain-containing protein n=1 Tax=Holothuria leucospilota TaxID=206669 RepID=A0A9Q0YBY6_HOLLE|nr:hypothetical protein HOLleu_43289 [Holothuria leucospilota]